MKKTPGYLIVFSFILALSFVTAMVASERVETLSGNPIKVVKCEQEILPDYVYKILTVEEMIKFIIVGKFNGNKDDKPFIHLLLEHQCEDKRQMFFGTLDAVYLCRIEPLKLGKGQLMMEANKPGGNEYPHLYHAQILLSAVTGIMYLPKGTSIKEGTWEYLLQN